MKRCLALAVLCIAAVFAFWSCDFSFLNETQSIPGEEGLHYHREYFPDDAGYRDTWHNAAEEVQFYDDVYTTNGLVMERQRLDSSMALEHAYAYAYDEQGNMTLEAYYDSASALAWFDAYAWTAEGNLDTQREYDAAGALQWARRYSYVAAVADGRILMGARFGSDLSLQAVACNEYDAFDRLKSTACYGEDPESRGLRAQVRASRMNRASRAAGSRALLGLALPAVPEMPVLEMPADAASVTLPASGRRYWFYDGDPADVPVTSVSFDAAWYPTSLSRHDPDTCPDINVALGYDSLKRISSKRTEYGSTVALDVRIEYEGDTLYPANVMTTGASLLLPLDYGIVYDSNHRPVRINVSSNGSLVHYFTYSYSGPAVPNTLEEAKTVDPFRFMDELMSAGLVISHYDGDGALVETFNASAIENGLRIDVRTPEGALNGWFILAKDTNGNSVSFTSYGADGAQTWAYAYDYTPAISELAAQTERILEYLPDGAADYAQAFIYDLLM